MLTKIILNGKVFEINTAVLMSYSKLVRNMIKYAKEDDGSINFDHLDLRSWQTVFSWINNYSQNFESATWLADKSEMMNLMVTANYLMMDELSAEVEDWFVSKISTKTVVEIHHFAKYHLAHSLQDKCMRFMMDNFTNIGLEYFHSRLEFEDMVQMLKSDDLTQTEEEITKFVKRIIMSNLYQDQGETSYSRKTLESCIRAWRLPCLPRTSKELVFSFGGWTDDPVAKISVYDPARRMWTDLDVDLPFNWSYMGAWLDGSIVYLCGGYTHGDIDTGTISKKLFSLDVNNLMEKLKPLSKMRTKRNYVCFQGNSNTGKIFAIGGNSGGFGGGNSRLDSVECYDIASNQWSELDNMRNRRSDAGIAVIDKQLYIVGGFNGTTVHSSVEVLEISGDSRPRRWRKIKNMSSPRSGVKAVGFGGKLYVVGGWNGNERLKSGEVYDPRKFTWKPLPDMNVPRSNFSLVVVNGQLMAFGGYDGHSVTARAEVLNWSTNAWEEVGALPTPRSALAGVTVSRSVLDKATIQYIRSKFEDSQQEEAMEFE